VGYENCISAMISSCVGFNPPKVTNRRPVSSGMDAGDLKSAATIEDVPFAKGQQMYSLESDQQRRLGEVYRSLADSPVCAARLVAENCPIPLDPPPSMAPRRSIIVGMEFPSCVRWAEDECGGSVNFDQICLANAIRDQCMVNDTNFPCEMLITFLRMQALLM